jgi:hypothetical protein
MNSIFDQPTQQNNFNNEVIWDNNMNLFDIYFKDRFFRNKCRIALAKIDEGESFEKALKKLKHI